MKRWEWRLLKSRTFYFHIMEPVPYKTAFHRARWQELRDLENNNSTTPRASFPQSRCACGDAAWPSPHLALSHLAQSPPGPAATRDTYPGEVEHSTSWQMGKHHPGALSAPKSSSQFREKSKPREEFSTAPLITRAAAWEQETLAGIPGLRAHPAPSLAGLPSIVSPLMEVIGGSSMWMLFA